MIDDLVSGGIKLVDDIINTAFPTPEAKASAEATKAKAIADAYVAQLQAAQAVMLAEEQSADPWTSRARPSFLYVIYLLILASLPMGVLFAFKPDVANAVIQGFHNWLAAIPDTYINLFGVGYLGYSGARSWDKHTDAKFKSVK